MSSYEEKWSEKQLTDSNWSEWDSKFKDRVSGYNRDVGYLLANKGVCNPEIAVTDLVSSRPKYAATRNIMNLDGLPKMIQVIGANGDPVEPPTWINETMRIYPLDEDGKSIYSSHVKKWDIRCARFEDAKVNMMGLLFKSVSDTIMEDMKVNDNYLDYRTAGDFYGMYELAKLASTGQGEYSMFLDITKIMDLKVVNENHNGYFTEYKACEYKIMNSGKTPEEVLKNMLTSLFYRGLRSSKKLKRLVEDEMTKQVWTAVPVSIKMFNTYLTARKNMGMDSESREGLISANEASVTVGNLKKILKARDKVATENLEAYAAYRAGGGTYSLKKWLCYNCGEMIDHGWKNCPKPRAICNICKKYHITSCHKTLEDKKLFRSKGGPPRTNMVRQANVSILGGMDTELSQDADYLEYVMMYEDRDLRANTASLRYEEADESDVDEEERQLEGYSSRIQINDVEDCVVDNILVYDAPVCAICMTEQDQDRMDQDALDESTWSKSYELIETLAFADDSSNLELTDSISIPMLECKQNDVVVEHVTCTVGTINIIDRDERLIKMRARLQEIRKLKEEMKTKQVNLVAAPVIRSRKSSILLHEPTTALSVASYSDLSSDCMDNKMTITKRAPPKVPRREAPSVLGSSTVKLPEPPDSSGSSNL